MPQSIDRSQHPFYRTRREARIAAGEMNRPLNARRVAPERNPRRNDAEKLLALRGYNWRVKALPVREHTVRVVTTPGTTSPRARVEIALNPIHPIKEADR